MRYVMRLRCDCDADQNPVFVILVLQTTILILILGFQKWSPRAWQVTAVLLVCLRS